MGEVGAPQQAKPRALSSRRVWEGSCGRAGTRRLRTVGPRHDTLAIESDSAVNVLRLAHCGLHGMQKEVPARQCGCRLTLFVGSLLGHLNVVEVLETMLVVDEEEGRVWRLVSCAVTWLDETRRWAESRDPPETVE